jgi:hypothetical protein
MTYNQSKRQRSSAESPKCQKSHLHMRVSLLTNDDPPDVGKSAETKTVHKPILLYKIYLLASGKADWTTRSLQSHI